MKFLIVTVAFVMFGLVHSQHEGNGHGDRVCPQPQGDNRCVNDASCSFSLCVNECLPVCEHGNCVCKEQHSNTPCMSVSHCTSACHHTQIPYCHEHDCHCHRAVECIDASDCSAICGTNQTPTCDADPDNSGHRHCHCS